MAPPADNSRSEIFKDLGLFALIGGEILGFTGAGVGLGYFAWSRWGAPWWVLILTSVGGLALAMVRIFRASQRLKGAP